MAQLKLIPRSYLFSPQRVPIHARSNFQKGIEYPHDHEFIEVVLVLRGTAEHETPAGFKQLRPGTVIILRPGTWHAYRQCERFKVYNCCFGPELLHHELAWLIENQTLGPLLWGNLSQDRLGVATFQISPSALRKCAQLLEDLSKALDSSSPISRQEITARLALFLTVLAGHLRWEKKGKPAQGSHPAVMACLRRIENDPAHAWRLTDLARESGTSREHLIRLCQQAIGCSPMAYLDRCRAEKAAALLKRTTLPVGEIGTLVGWESPVTFSRRFKAHFGVSATDYRERLN